MAKLCLVETESACSMHLEFVREMASATSEQNKMNDSGGSTLLESIMKDPSSPKSTSSSSKDSYQAEWLANNNTNDMVTADEDSNKDYYAKYEEDSRFRSFVKCLLRSSSEANISQSSKHSKKLEKLETISDNKDNTENKAKKLESRKPKSNSNQDPNLNSKSHTTKHNDDIPAPRGKYQDMVRERWGEHRRLDSRIGGERNGEARPAAHNMAKQTQENSQKQNSADFDSDYKIAKSRSYATLPGERASVVLRQKHKQLGGQGREEVTNSGVFSLPRVSCYHRSTRVWV